MDINNYNNINLILDWYSLEIMNNTPTKYRYICDVSFNCLELDIYLYQDIDSEELFIEMLFYDVDIILFKWKDTIHEFNRFELWIECSEGIENELIVLGEFLDFCSLKNKSINIAKKYDLR